MHYPRAFLRLAAVAILVACGDPVQRAPDADSPSPTAARITLGARLVGATPAIALALPAIDNVRIALVRPPADTLRDLVVTVAAGQSMVAIDLTVNINGIEETLIAGIQLRSGETVLFSGEQTVVARAGVLGVPTENPPIPIVYVGPGASVSRIDIAPAQASVPIGGTRQFTASGFDASGAPVDDLIVSWTTSDGTVGTIDEETGLFHAGQGTGSVIVRATSPNGVFGEATVSVAQQGPDPLPGGDVVVFNDVNIFFNNALEDPLADNPRFVRNIVNFTTTEARNAGTVVLWDCGRNTRWNACIDASHSTVRTLIEAQGLTLQMMASSSGTLTSIPANVKTLWLWLPMVTYTNAEINALKQFAAEGGRLVFIGEFDGFYTAQGLAVENDFLTRMGAVLRNTGGAVDCGAVLIPSSSIRPHQIMEGVNQLHVACASVIDPGPDDYPLFYDATGTQVLGGVAKVDLTPIPGAEGPAVQAMPVPARSGIVTSSPSGR